MFVVKNILVPTDFSDFSAEAFKYASTFAVIYDAHLHVLHVAHAENVPTNGQSHGINELKNFIQKNLPHQKKVIEAIAYGQPHKEIVRYAHDEGIDLVVIATHGRTGLTHFMMGSVAEKVVRFSPVPVMTVKPPALASMTGNASNEIPELQNNENIRSK